MVHLDWRQADELLLANEQNREERPGWVRQLRKIIRDGRWKLTNDAIVVDSLGKVRNGQHRLFAISGERATGLPVLLLEGAAPDDAQAYDSGKLRGPNDLLRLRGKSGSTQHVAAARMMVHGEQRFEMLVDAVDFTVRHWEAVDFAVRQTQKYQDDRNIRGLCRAGFTGVLARAYLSAHLRKSDALIVFADAVLKDGCGRRFDGRDLACRWLRDHVVKEWNRTGRRIEQTDVFWLTQTVLSRWLEDVAFDPKQHPVKYSHLFPYHPNAVRSV